MPPFILLLSKLKLLYRDSCDRTIGWGMPSDTPGSSFKVFCQPIIIQTSALNSNQINQTLALWPLQILRDRLLISESCTLLRCLLFGNPVIFIGSGIVYRSHFKNHTRSILCLAVRWTLKIAFILVRKRITTSFSPLIRWVFHAMAISQIVNQWLTANVKVLSPRQKKIKDYHLSIVMSNSLWHLSFFNEFLDKSSGSEWVIHSHNSSDVDRFSHFPLKANIHS